MISGKMYRFRVEPELAEPGLLEAFLQSSEAQSAIDDMKTGISDSGLNLTHDRFTKLPVVMPPRREQRRILNAIESYFTRLDETEHLLERARRNLERYRAAVLMSAVEGRLVPQEADEDGNLTAEGDSMTGLPAGWCERPLAELIREPLRNGHSAKRTTSGGIRTLTLTAVTKRDFSDRNTKLTSADPHSVRDLWLEPGDILIQRSNTPDLVGTAALFRGQKNFAIFPDLLIRVRPAEDLLPAFLELVLRAAPARAYFREAAQGISGSMPKIDQLAISRLTVPVPPLNEQRRIITEAERLLSISEALSRITSASLARSKSVRTSTLQWAFEGRLVDQDPTDEPASALLARIRAERVSKPAKALKSSARRNPKNTSE